MNNTVVKWDFNKNDEPEIDHFRLKCGSVSGQYTSFIDVPDKTIRTYGISTDTDFLYASVVAVKDSIESNPSNEILIQW